jgi:PAS domain S-box-containing protein
MQRLSLCGSLLAIFWSTVGIYLELHHVPVHRLGSKGQRIYRTLRSAIADGRYPEGSQLPSYEQLAENFGVASMTARHAVALLEDEGLVERRPGRGTFVQDDAALGDKTLHLSAVVHSSQDAIVTSRLDGTIVDWSRGATHLLGYAPGDIRGCSMQLLVPESLRDEWLQAMECVQHGQYVDPFETLRLHQDGTPVHLSIDMAPLFDATGRVVGCATVARDITDRVRLEGLVREREQWLNQVVSHAPLFVWAIDARGTITLCEGARRSTFRGVPEWRVGTSIFDLLPAGSRYRAAVERALLGDDVQELVTYRSLDCEVWLHPVHGPVGELDSVIGITAIRNSLDNLNSLHGVGLDRSGSTSNASRRSAVDPLSRAAELSTSLAVACSEETILGALVQCVSALTASDHIAVWESDQTGEDCTLVHAMGWQGQRPASVSSDRHLRTARLTALRTGELQISESPSVGTAGNPAQLIAFVPFIGSGTVSIAVEIHCVTTERPTDEVQSALTVVAGLAALALSALRLRDALRAEIADQTALLSARRAIDADVEGVLVQHASLLRSRGASVRRDTTDGVASSCGDQP